MADLRPGDIGVVFDVSVKQDGGILPVNDMTTREIVFTSPSGAVVVKSASLVSDGLDGRIKYTSVSGDFSERGNWGIQAHLAKAGFDKKSRLAGFSVG
jgi:hypothetical protein